MRMVNRCVFGFIAASVSAFAGFAGLAAGTSRRYGVRNPDVNAFEERSRTTGSTRAHRWIGKDCRGQGAEGPSATPLAKLRRGSQTTQCRSLFLNAHGGGGILTQRFRDRAMAMTRKVERLSRRLSP